VIVDVSNSELNHRSARTSRPEPLTFKARDEVSG
jgi:hypothetical protein